MAILKSTIKTLVFVYGAQTVYFFLVNHGVGIHFNNVKPGPCRIVPGISCGSEQISVTNDGLAFITSGVKTMTNCNRKYLKGRMYLFNFNKPNENVTELKIQSENLDLDFFQPLGMDILEKNDDVKVFVVNHAAASIEIFLFDRMNRHILKHIQTITNEKFVCLNDITLVNENSFYVTNFAQFCKYPPIMMAEFFLQLPTSNIIHFESGETRNVASGESLLNGITIATDKKKLFTVSSNTGRLLEFLMNVDSGSLHLVNRHFIGFHPDNIFMDHETGVLYVGTQKTTFNHFLLSENQTDHCTATGVTIKQNASGHMEVEEILHMNGGKFVNSISVVAHYKGHYLFGTPFDRLGYCIDRSIINSKNKIF